MSFKDINANHKSTLSIIGKDKHQVRFKAGKIFLNSVKNILFKNITIEDCIGDGIGINNASNISFIGCQILNTKGWAFTIANSKKIAIQSCDISGTRKGAIYITSKVQSDNTFENNYIHDLHLNKESVYPAIDFNGFGVTFKNNLFTDIPNQAIVCNNGGNLIEYNEFVNCSFNNGKGVIYSSNVSSGNIIKYNYLHDNKKSSCGGIFSNNCKNIDSVYGNIFKNVDNAVSLTNEVNVDLTNNVFINCNSVFISRPSQLANKLDLNIVYDNNKSLLNSKIENNICIGGFWDVNSYDLHSNVDSLFHTKMAVKNNLFDFTTRASSTANLNSHIIKIGYTNLDLINPYYDNFNIETSNFPANFKYVQIPFQQIGINIKQWSEATH